jgi:hypothetical protein
MQQPHHRGLTAQIDHERDEIAVALEETII